MNESLILFRDEHDTGVWKIRKMIKILSGTFLSLAIYWWTLANWYFEDFGFVAAISYKVHINVKGCN